jgi:cytochrome c oxidase subunit I
MSIEDKDSHQTHWREYFSFSTDHKVIGVQYLVTAFVFFLIGGLLAMIVRAELLTPQLDVVSRSLYNGLFTMHGTIMIFLWIFPANLGLANFLVPLMIGARDMAFPRLNAIAFWQIPIVGILLLISFFLPSGTAQAGWWSYPPVSIQNPSGQLINGEFVWLLAVAISGVSSIMGGVNFVTTIVQMRAPGMTYFRMPVYVWTIFSAQLLQLFCLPALTGAAIMLLFDLSFGTNFFSPFSNGDPIIYQHLFWFYSHPAVYVMALPAFGVFSEVIPTFARKPLFGYKVVAVSSFIIAIVGTFVWVHHIFYGFDYAGSCANWFEGFCLGCNNLAGKNSA